MSRPRNGIHPTVNTSPTSHAIGDADAQQTWPLGDVARLLAFDELTAAMADSKVLLGFEALTPTFLPSFKVTGVLQ